MELHGNTHLSVRTHMAFYLLPLIIFTLIRKLKYLVPFSFVANICFGFGILAIIYIMGLNYPPISSRRYIGEIQNIPLFFGTVMYSFEGIGLVCYFIKLLLF